MSNVDSSRAREATSTKSLKIYLEMRRKNIKKQYVDTTDGQW